MVADGLVTFIRKTRILLTPPGMKIKTRLKGGLIFSGRNKPGYMVGEESTCHES